MRWPRPAKFDAEHEPGSGREAETASVTSILQTLIAINSSIQEPL
jgi:hypothetical protein